MSIKRKSRYEIKLMKHAGEVVALTHRAIKEAVRPGISTKDLDKIAYDVITSHHADPTFLGYNGFPATICASINEMVVHGIPSDDIILKEGDIISVDIGATLNGFVGDSAWTYPVGEIDDDKKRLLKLTEESLFAALSTIKNGSMLSDIGGAVEDIAIANNLGIVRQYGGHGVGSQMHEEPFIYNYRADDKRYREVVLKTGMTIAVEPMLMLGKDDVIVAEDNWGVFTMDRKPAAHFEHTVAVTDDGYEILTCVD